MASGAFESGTYGYVSAYVTWSSTAGTGGSTVTANLYFSCKSGAYFSATLRNGFSLSINGNSTSGSFTDSRRISGNYHVLSHSVWVGYTGNASINISGSINATNIYNGSIGGYLTTYNAGATVALDKVGSIPTMGTVTAPTTATISETSTTIAVKWNKASSYSGACSYRVDVSINGGAYNWVSGDINNINTLSYSYTISNKEQGATYQFRVCAGNDVGFSGHQYSSVVTINKLSPPVIGNIAIYNPFVTTSVSVPLTGGGATIGGNVRRLSALYYGTTKLVEVAYTGVADNNTTCPLTYSSSNYLVKLGTTKYTDTFRVVAWVQNANGTKSTTVEKEFTVNINSDGGATPSLGAPTISGGILGATSTCFVAGVNSMGVTSTGGAVRRAPSGTTLTYTISCTGYSATSGASRTLTNLTAGTKDIIVTVKDSRGLSTSQTVKKVVQPWAKPTLTITKCERTTADNTKVLLNYTMSYSPIYTYSSPTVQGTQLNNISLQQFSINTGGYTTTSNGATLTGFNVATVYTVNVRCADKVSTTAYTISSKIVGTVAKDMSLKKWGLGLGCIPQNGNRLEVSGKSVFNGTLRTTDATNGSFTTAGGLTFIKSLVCSVNEGFGWNSGSGRIHLNLRNDSSQMPLMASYIGSVRAYSMELLQNSTFPHMRFYVGSKYILELKPNDAIVNGSLHVTKLVTNTLVVDGRTVDLRKLLLKD